MKKKTVQKTPAAPRPWLRWLSPLLCVAGLVAIAIGLMTNEEEYLWKVQELNLHLDTPLFLRQQMVVAGGLLTWLGTWFTEFFYHPLLGVGWLCLWWALLMVLASKAFRVPLKWSALLLVPVALLLITCVDLGYWIYYLKLRGHFFVATIGLCAMCATVWAFRCLPASLDRFYIRPAFIVLATAVLYPLIGFYALLTALVMGVMAFTVTFTETGKKSRTKIALSIAVALTLAIVVIPLLYYRFVFYQTSQGNIWWTALPMFRIIDEHPTYYLPYWLLAIFFVLLAALSRKLPKGNVKKLLPWALVHVVLAIVLVWGTKLCWYDDYNFHKELRMVRYMEAEDWNGVMMEAADQQDEPTRAIVMMRNLALFRLGRQGDEMYRYRQGAKPSNTPIPVSMMQVCGCSLYYFYGLPNYCQRWCMEDGVEFGWRAEYLKQLTRCALVNNEHVTAAKYMNLLKHTRYHGEWVEKYEKYLNNMEAVRSDQNFQPVLHLMDHEDKLSSDQTVVEQFLMYHFVNDASDDVLYQDMSLNAALWTKDIQTFWPFFDKYARNHRAERMPVHYQEAAYLYGHLENNIDISQMPFDESVKQNYENLRRAAENCSRMGMSEEKMKEALYPQFGQTFYFEYFLVRNMKLY
jgi:hypothetical protein